jgi:hypothetical protein
MQLSAKVSVSSLGNGKINAQDQQPPDRTSRGLVGRSQH